MATWMPGTVACTRPMPRLADTAHARGIELRLMAEARGAPVRMVHWSVGDGCPAALLEQVQVHWGPARSLLLVEGDAAALAAGLDAGADDAVGVDASPVEIVARLSSLFRSRDARRITVGDLTIDRMTRNVACAGKRLPLSPREYAVLLHLAENAGVAVSRAQLLRSVWHCRVDPGTNVVQVQVSRLRAALDAAGAPVLHTDRGRGYRLGEPAV